MLQDIDGILNRLGPQSVLIITIDARPRLPKDQHDLSDKGVVERETLTAAIYRDWFGSLAGTDITPGTVAGEHVASLFYEVVLERIGQTLIRRGGGLRFLQLFNYLYRDGAPMLTLGGMVGTENNEHSFRTCGILEHRFVRTTRDCLEISVPPLTFREKQWLDSHLDTKLTTDQLCFELDYEVLENYRKFYQQYPTFMESLL